MIRYPDLNPTFSSFALGSDNYTTSGSNASWKCSYLRPWFPKHKCQEKSYQDVLFHEQHSIQTPLHISFSIFIVGFDNSSVPPKHAFSLPLNLPFYSLVD